jgi:segregation and condensation protein B
LPRGSDDLSADEDPLDGDEQTPLEMHLPEASEGSDETPSS